MIWSEFYFVCFLVGFSLSALAVLAGSVHLHIPHLHFHHGIHMPHAGGQSTQLPYFNFGTLSAFLAWFGGIGYLLQRYSGIWYVAVLAIATLSGLAAASAVFWFVAKVFIAREKPLDQADYDMVGVLGRVSLPIRVGGTGEITYSQEGTRHVSGARAEQAVPIPKGAEVIVTRYEKGIAYVRPWQDPAEEWESSSR
jgi:membrane protein implicated in regulation of membrane protease activity